MKLYIPHSLLVPNSKTHTFPLMEVLEKDVLDVEIVTSLEVSDMVVAPTDIQYLFLHGKRKEFFKISEETKSAGKKILVFTGSDYGKTLLDEHIIQVRLGGFKSKMNQNTFIMPPFIEDPYILLNKKYSAISKGGNPSIGFVGHSNGSFVKLLKEFVLFLRGNVKRLIGLEKTDLQSFYPSSRRRFNYLEILEKAPEVGSNFIYRQQYRAGAVSKEDKKRTSVAFYQNMYDNLYTFCLRGTGNFSVRLYETLAMGRIPVLVNTDCKLPFDTLINWKQHALIIHESDVKELPKCLLQFHKQHSEEALKSMQDKNRQLWQDYFQKESYFNALINQLNTN